MSSTPLARIAGPLAIAAGLILILNRVVTFFTIPTDLQALQTAVQSPINVTNGFVQIVAFALLAIALVAIYEVQAHAAGWLGAVGVGVALLGTVFMAGDWWYEGFGVPWLADVAPVVFETGATGLLLAGGLTSFILFGIGWFLFAVASYRADVFPRSTSLVLLAGGLTSGVPIAGAYLYGNAVLALAVAGMGAWLLRSAAVSSGAAEPARA